MKRIVSLLLALLLVVSTGCRVRTTVQLNQPPTVEMQEQENEQPPQIEEEPEEPEQPLESEETPPEEEPEQPEETEEPVDPDTDAPTEEDPDADRKEYDEDASADIVTGSDNALQVEEEDEQSDEGDSEAEGSGQETGTAEDSAAASDDAAETVTETVPSDKADQAGVSDEGEIAETMIYYYMLLLVDRLSSLFECEKPYLYWESTEDYKTVFKTSLEHALILEAGAYNVSAKLLEENLIVDDGWVQRKNPSVIVKVVDSSVLGSGIVGTAAAQAVYNELVGRPGWSQIDAVKKNCVILISQELMERQAMQTAAAVYIAKAVYPSLFEDVDADEALRLLSEEATGLAASGTFVFVG